MTDVCVSLKCLMFLSFSLLQKHLTWDFHRLKKGKWHYVPQAVATSIKLLEVTLIHAHFSPIFMYVG